MFITQEQKKPANDLFSVTLVHHSESVQLKTLSNKGNKRLQLHLVIFP